MEQKGRTRRQLRVHSAPELPVSSASAERPQRQSLESWKELQTALVVVLESENYTSLSLSHGITAVSLAQSQ